MLIVPDISPKPAGLTTAPVGADTSDAADAVNIENEIAAHRQAIAQMASRRDAEEKEYAELKSQYDKIAARLTQLRESLMRTSQERSQRIKALDHLLQTKGKRDNARLQQQGSAVTAAALSESGAAKSTPPHHAVPPVSTEPQAPPLAHAATPPAPQHEAPSAQEKPATPLQQAAAAAIPSIASPPPRPAGSPPPRPPTQTAAAAVAGDHPHHTAASVARPAAASTPPPPPPRPSTHSAGATERPPMFGAGPSGSIKDRVKPRVPLAVEVDFGSDSNLYVGFSENVSEGGIFVATMDAKPVGERMTVQFTLPGEQTPLVCNVEVAWSVPYRDDDPDSVPGMGLRFINLSDDARATLMRFIAQREPLFFPG